MGATANFSSTTLTGQNTSFANYRVNQMFGGLTTAAASTSADLAQGIIRFSASTSTPNPGFTGGGSANAQVTINEPLMFQIAPGSSGLIGVNFSLTGKLTSMSGIASSDLPLFEFDGAAGDGFVHASDTQNGTTLQTSGGWVSTNFAGTTTQNLIFQGVYQLTGPLDNVLVDFNPIAAVSGGTSMSDYSATGQLSLTLPAGVTFTSSDGFLSGSAIPEPGSLWPIASGIALLLGWQARGRGAGRCRRS